DGWQTASSLRDLRRALHARGEHLARELEEALNRLKDVPPDPAAAAALAAALVARLDSAWEGMMRQVSPS
ncbi:MAG: hypothetical protein AB1758_30330, partial [Candidatus Eremiobacterota bacterium]